MQIPVNVETFLKFAKLARNNSPNEARKYLRSILVEVSQGNAFIFATDSRFAAVQRLGSMSGEFKVNVTVDDTMMNQAQAEKGFSSSFIVSMQGVSTSLGFTYPGNPFVSPSMGTPNVMLTWRDVFRPKEKGNGTASMFIDAERMEFLRETSPSGRIVFPPKIDTSRPIVVKDAVDPDWLGVFIGQSEDENVNFGSLPDWIANV